jgi:hypothetical protein
MFKMFNVPSSFTKFIQRECTVHVNVKTANLSRSCILPNLNKPEMVLDYCPIRLSTRVNDGFNVQRYVVWDVRCNFNHVH